MNKTTDKEAAHNEAVQRHNLLMSKWEHQGSLLTDIANTLDSLNDCDAPNALHARVAVVEKIIDIINSIEP